MQRSVFRKVALERLSSPEQLDQAMQVTTPLGWLGLLTLVLLIGAALAWSVAGSIATQVGGQGILLRAGGLQQVVAAGSGQIDRLYVQVGDTVQPGQLVARLHGGDTVVSFNRGRVLELLVDRGSVIELGAPLLSLEDSDAPLEAVLYVPAAVGDRVQPGMPVQLAPSSANPQSYGFLRGTVKSIGRFPSTRRTMLRTLLNEELVDQFLAAGSPVAVQVALEPEPQTTSGYRWSTADGPPAELYAGTLCRATITIGTQRPIELLLPR